ncbi:MAG: cold-shock protein [Bacteroidales bacterium]
MASSQETYNKRDQEKKRLKKRLDKAQKLAERKANSPGGGLENMIAYVDENGNITDTPPNPANRTKIDAGSIEIGVPKREAVEVPSIRKGRVEFFNHSKGFGFIKETDSQEKFFVHVNGLIDEIRENDMVTFELERGFKGMSAVGVKKV